VPNHTRTFITASGNTFTNAIVPMMMTTGIHSQEWKEKDMVIVRTMAKSEKVKK
jgi:hypothetical protein